MVAKVIGAIQAWRDGGDGEDPYHDRLTGDLTRHAVEVPGESMYEDERAPGLQMGHSERLDLIARE